MARGGLIRLPLHRFDAPVDLCLLGRGAGMRVGVQVGADRAVRISAPGVKAAYLNLTCASKHLVRWMKLPRHWAWLAPAQTRLKFHR